MKNLCVVRLQFLAAVLIATLFVASGTALAADKQAGKVVVYNWSEYIPQDVLDDFTKETGIQVIYSTFESNEAMIAKVKLMKGKGYDVVAPSNYFLDRMTKEGLLQELDHSKLPNLANINPKWLNLDFDKGNKYSAPYMWGVTGLAYNSKYVKPEELTKWADLTNSKFKGKIIMSDDLRDVFSLAFKAVGLGNAETSEDAVKKAYEFMRELRPSVRIFDVTATKQALISEEVWLGPIWNGDYLVAREENDDLRFVFPAEGAILWMDTFAIPAGAENVENAHAFINYMMRPEVAVKCVREYKYSTPNLKALDLMTEEERNNTVLNPTEKELQHAEFPGNIGDSLALYNKYWEMLKTGR